MQRLAFIITAAWIALSIPALAQDSGTPEDRRACSPSVKRYCTQAIQGGDMAVLACLQQNRSRIAPACQQVLIKYGQ